ncbi:MAG: FkbM family methyltransferase [Hoeflea sp. D1-CHI-28]
MTIVSYAQNFEDIMLLRAVGDVSEGFYIDIGACSPDADSVTRLFYNKGWRGINVEPHPHFLQKLRQGRPEDKNLGLVITKTEGIATFHKVGDTGLSSTNPDIAKSHQTSGLPITELEVPAMTLRGLWSEHVPKGREVHFLKIDVEGAEANVIAGGNWQEHRPWIVVVEATLPNSQTPNHGEWENHLLDNGYSFVYWDGLNRFYLANEHQDRGGAFSAPPNVFDDFIRYSQALVEQQANSLIQERSALIQKRSALIQGKSRLQRKVELLRQEVEKLEIENRYLTQSLWRRSLFHKGGKPRRLLWRLLFHKNGKPRGVFRDAVLRKDGMPREPFSQWMTSAEYQALPRAIKLTYQTGDGLSYAQISARTRFFVDRLSATDLDE